MLLSQDNKKSDRPGLIYFSHDINNMFQNNYKMDLLPAYTVSENNQLNHNTKWFWKELTNTLCMVVPISCLLQKFKKKMYKFLLL